MSKEVYITGIGFIKVSEHWKKSLRALAFEAAELCLKDVNYTKPDLIIVSNALGGILQSQESLSSLIAENLSLTQIPNLKIETGESSGASAILIGYLGIASGLYKNVLIIGVEKNSDKLPSEFISATSSFLDQEYFSYYGITPAALYALLYKLYLKKYKEKQENVAQFATHDHKMALNVEHAQYRFDLSVEKILASPILADPIRLFESYSVSDGAAAIMLSSKDQIQDKDYAIKIEGISISTDINLIYRNDLLLFNSLKTSFENLKKKNKIENKDINFIEIFDPYTIASPIIIESLGLVKRGEGSKMLLEGYYEKDGKLPLNTHGGLKARGHPIGASPLYQLCEGVLQLRGKAKNQVPNANIGLLQSMSTTAEHNSLILLKRL